MNEKLGLLSRLLSKLGRKKQQKQGGNIRKSASISYKDIGGLNEECL